MTESAAEYEVSPAPALSPTEAVELATAMRREIARAVVGQGEVVDGVLIALFSAGHVLLEGVPGLGKTLLVRALARTFRGSFARIQFTPDLMPSDVTGHAMYDPKTMAFTIRRGPVFTHLLLADEINRAPAKTQAALLEVMQEGQVTIEGRPLPVEAPFLTLATQNPIEQEGTYPLPEAQLDRFLLKLRIGYPTEGEEQELVERLAGGRIGEGLDVTSVAEVLDPPTVLAIQRLVATLHVERRVSDYAVAIVRATRNWPGVALGAGPRGSLALIRAARAHALLDGRDYVLPDDVKALAPAALRHRIALAPEAQIEGYTADDVLATLLGQVEAPRA